MRTTITSTVSQRVTNVTVPSATACGCQDSGGWLAISVDYLLCIDSTLVGDYWAQESGLSCLRATGYGYGLRNGDKIGKETVSGSDNVFREQLCIAAGIIV
jgi:hypothetical protein